MQNTLKMFPFCTKQKQEQQVSAQSIANGSTNQSHSHYLTYIIAFKSDFVLSNDRNFPMESYSVAVFQRN